MVGAFSSLQCLNSHGSVLSCGGPLEKNEERTSHSALLENGELQKRNHKAATSQSGIEAEVAVFVQSLRSCTKNRDLHQGSRIHDDILSMGLLEECSDALVTMYAKCGELGTAEVILDVYKSRDVITWTAVIAGYAQEGEGEKALNCFECMQHVGVIPNAVTYSCALKACGMTCAIDKGKEIHDVIVTKGLLYNHIVLGTALVDMYAKCRALLEAQDVLVKLPFRNVVSWSALIAGYAQEGHGYQALNCYERMQHEGIVPDAVTFACILKACASERATYKGKQIHDDIARQGLLCNNIVLGTALVDMYSKCGALSEAQDVLEELPSRNGVSWNALLAGYAQEGQGEQALICFQRMQHDGILPDAVTYTCLLKACASVRALDKGKQIHDKVTELGLLDKNTILGNALVDMYAKCGALSKAHCVLKGLSSRNVVTWSALIAGYTQEGQGEQALNCFECMENEGIVPNAVTYACILKACAAVGAADKGKEFHNELARQGLLSNDIMLSNALVHMYAKFGALSRAQRVLEEIPSRSVVSWSALVAGYAQKGQIEQALLCFERMQHEGILPNVVTFISVLNGCSHEGLLEEGHSVFASMSIGYGMEPNLECYSCMVDLFARAGHLEKASRLIDVVPSFNYSDFWLALLGACQRSGDIHVGNWAFRQAVQMDKGDGSAYVLMSNVCTVDTLLVS